VTVITLGPYRRGEIPPPLTYTYLDSTGAAITLPASSVAKLEIETPTGSIIERTAAVATQTGSTIGQVTYIWVAADFPAAGTYRAELWAGKDSSNKYASARLVWVVEAAIQVPVL
jgi:hypothetical protein